MVTPTPVDNRLVDLRGSIDARSLLDSKPQREDVEPGVPASRPLGVYEPALFRPSLDNAPTTSTGDNKNVRASIANRAAMRALVRRVSNFGNMVGTLPAACVPAHSALEPPAEEDLVATIQSCIDGTGGELSALQQAASLGERYLRLDPSGRLNFLVVVVENFGPDDAKVRDAMLEFRLTEGEEAPLETKLQRMYQLRRSLRPRWITLLKQFNSGVELGAFSNSTGMRFVLDMRADVLAHAKTRPALKPLDTDMKDLLQTWFDFGFLTMDRLTWSSPAATLQQLIQYEAVHKIASWVDLQSRLEHDRRVYAFFHARLPGTPLIFVEVALTTHVPGSIQKIIDLEDRDRVQDPEEATCAIFYSISNTQVGLQGVSFGNLLIKRVVASLQKDLPQITQFSTLSPIPGFGAWFREQLHSSPDVLQRLCTKKELDDLYGVTTNGVTGADLFQLIDSTPLKDDPKLASALKTTMLRLCATFLLNVKGRGNQPKDPVARFHLANGAYIYRYVQECQPFAGSLLYVLWY